MSKIKFKPIDINKLPSKMANKIELEELKKWFNDYYTIHYQKYNRLIALKQLDENPEKKLKLLYEEAEKKRARIKEIEGE